MIHPINMGNTAAEDEVQPVPAESTSSPTATPMPMPMPTPTPSGRRRKKAKQLTPPTKDMIPLHPQFQPGKLDVICSRGKFAYNSPGNCWFRTMVEEQMDNYAGARTKTDKSLVVSVLVNRVRNANPQGGFIKNFGGRWYRVSDRYSREKVGQQFRDLLHTKYRSSTKAKAEKRKREHTEDDPLGLNNSSSSFEEDRSSKSTRERLNYVETSSKSTHERLQYASGVDTSCSGKSTRERLQYVDTSCSGKSTRERLQYVDTSSSSKSTRERLQYASGVDTSCSGKSTRERLQYVDTSSSSKRTRERIQHTSPRHYYNSPGSVMAPSAALVISSGKDSSVEIPPMGLDSRSAFLTLHPGYGHSATLVHRGPDEGEFQPETEALDQGTMDLEYLDDFEPLPMLGGSSDHIDAFSRSNSLNLATMGLPESFGPNFFTSNSPDMHQSLPAGSLESHHHQRESNNNGRRDSADPQQGPETADPFFLPWHMSI